MSLPYPFSIRGRKMIESIQSYIVFLTVVSFFQRDKLG